MSNRKDHSFREVANGMIKLTDKAMEWDRRAKHILLLDATDTVGEMLGRGKLII